jgi:hypothetical protein
MYINFIGTYHIKMGKCYFIFIKSYRVVPVTFNLSLKDLFLTCYLDSNSHSI